MFAPMSLLAHLFTFHVFLLSFAGAQFASVSGLEIALDGTNPTRWAGINAWYTTGHQNDTEIDMGFEKMATDGLKVVRVWGFRTIANRDPRPGEVWFQRLDSANLSTGATATYTTNVDGDLGLHRIDVVLDLAEKWGLKVIIVFANYFPELGGIQTYVDAFGGDKTTWYSDPTSQAAYRDYITTLVNRYRENCNVLAWELMNEPRCKSATNVPCDPNVVTDWANATSAWIKADQPEGLGDQNHLVSVGDEGWFHPNNLPIDADGSYPYTGAEGVDTVALLDLPTIDFGTFHMYPDRWSEEDSWGATWINQHSDLAVEHNKPIILEEYGKEKASGVRAAVVGAWQEAAVNSRVAGDLYWEISLAFAARYTTGDDTAIYLNDTDYTQLVTDHAAAMAATSQDGEPSADIEPSENIEPSADVEPSPDDA